MTSVEKAAFRKLVAEKEHWYQEMDRLDKEIDRLDKELKSAKEIWSSLFDEVRTKCPHDEWQDDWFYDTCKICNLQR